MSFRLTVLTSMNNMANVYRCRPRRISVDCPNDEATKRRYGARRCSRPKIAKIVIFLVAVLLRQANPVQAETGSLDLTIHYEVPEFGMKLIILNEEEISLDEYQKALDSVVTKHMNEFFRENLPTKELGGLVNKDSFSKVTLHSKVVNSPINEDEVEGVRLKIIRAGFDGVGEFHFSPEVATAASLYPSSVEDAVYLLHHVKEALREDGGFWDLATEIAKNSVLSGTGKLQIAVGSLVVGEGSLVEDDADEELSKAAVTLISIFVPVGFISLVVAGFLIHRKIRNMKVEKLKQDRRDRARKRRIYGSSSAGSSRSISLNSDSGGSRDWDNNNNTDKKSAVSGRANQQPNRLIRSRPALMAKQKSSESLLHCITEESGHDDTSRRSDKETEQDIENIYDFRGIQGFDEGFQSCALIDFGDSMSSDGSKASIVNSTGGAHKDQNFEKTQLSVLRFESFSQNDSYSVGGAGDLNSGSVFDYNLSQQENDMSKSSYTDVFSTRSSTVTKQQRQPTGSATYASGRGTAEKQQEVFGLMNQEGLDTINPDEFDFDLNMSAANLSFDEADLNCSLGLDENMDIATAMATFGQSMNFGDFASASNLSMEIGYGTADGDYELRIDPNLEFA